MRFYLLAIFFFIGVVPLFISTVVLINTYEDKAVNNRVAELQNQGKLLSTMLLPTGYLTKGDIPELDVQISRTSEMYSGRILVVNNNLKIIKDTYSLEDGRYLVSAEVLQTFRGTNSRIINKEN